MEVLQQSPEPAQIETCIHTFSDVSVTESLKLVLALLKYVIPETYELLPARTQRSIIKVFRSGIGLGNLLSKIKLLNDSKSSAKSDILKLLRTHSLLLTQVLSPGLVSQMLKDASPPFVREVDKLLFKGLCFSIFKEAAMKFEIQAPGVLRSPEAYTVFLSQELSQINMVNPFLSSLLSLGAHASFFEEFFHRERLLSLKRFHGALRRFEKKQLFSKYLDFLLLRYLRKPASWDLLAALSVITMSSELPIMDELMLENVISSYNYNLNMLVPLLMTNAKEHIQKLLLIWGNKTLIANESITKQGFRTHALLCLCEQLTLSEAQELMKLAAFVEAISNRLSSLSHQVKSLGVFFADRISDLAQAPRIFEMETAQDDISLAFPRFSVKSADITLSIDEAWDILDVPSVITPEEHQMELSLEPLTLNAPSLEIDVSDEEDDPSIGSKKPIPKPIYIRDLLAYLSVDVKEPEAYDKRRIALRTAPSLLRQKLSFGTEVSFYAEDLMTQLVALTNHFEDTTFEVSRLNAMISVVVSHPDVTPHVCQLLLTGDFSLQQRLCLLSAMSFAARALRGEKDEIVQASFTPSNFASQRLPENLHNQYEAMDHGYLAIENKLQNQLMYEASEKARDSISGGRVLRISSKLSKKGISDALPDSTAGFAKMVGKRFFFPLVAVWYESGGIDIGHYSPMLISHYVRTLSLILHSAYPNATDLNEMAGEFLALITPLLQNTTIDQIQVLESIATGVLLICEIIDQVYMVTHFEHNLLLVESTFQECWESIIDERVKSLCAGLLLKLSEFRQATHKTLIGQINGGLY